MLLGLNLGIGPRDPDTFVSLYLDETVGLSPQTIPGQVSHCDLCLPAFKIPLNLSE